MDGAAPRPAGQPKRIQEGPLAALSSPGGLTPLAAANRSFAAPELSCGGQPTHGRMAVSWNLWLVLVFCRPGQVTAKAPRHHLKPSRTKSSRVNPAPRSSEPEAERPNKTNTLRKPNRQTPKPCVGSEPGCCQAESAEPSPAPSPKSSKTLLKPTVTYTLNPPTTQKPGELRASARPV